MEKSSYIGKKGYTLYKDSLSIKEQTWLRDKLIAKPYIPKAPVQPEGFPIYRESKSKFYIPRFFGIDNFGPVDNNLPQCDSINIKFEGELKPFQNNVVDSYLNTVNEMDGGGGLLEVKTGGGKTTMALNIISKLSVKTLVIVHKSFLLKQWEERILQFLPTAKIGKIQGQIIDIDGKDIVIGMLQSLSMKEYPANLFDSFGLTICDETHHLSSEIFSRALQYITTKYMLGLSATMQRKDGLTWVFKTFLGEIVYKDKRENEHDVLIKGIKYITNDEEFNEVKTDYRGNPIHSALLSKICNFNPRTEFILKVIEKELQLFPNQHIMILAQYKTILTYLYKAIEYRNIATVGYYVGGMKEADLKLSENKQIMIATYAMAEEGLDVPSLTTLILVTPRTDVTQAVGRILRKKHERPLVIDIIDQHSVFKNQWEKRKKFYLKNKYSIINTTNSNYLINKWEDQVNIKTNNPKTCKLNINLL